MKDYLRPLVVRSFRLHEKRHGFQMTKVFSLSIVLAAIFSVNSANATLYYIHCHGFGSRSMAAAFTGFHASWSDVNQAARHCKKYSSGDGTSTIWQIGPKW